MFIDISYGDMAIMFFAGWILHILLSVKPMNLSYDEWFEYKDVLVNQATEIFYLLLAIPLCWVGHNVSLFGYSLSFILWAIRIYAAIVAVPRLFIAITEIPRIFEPYEFRLLVSNLCVSAAGILLALAA